LTVLTAQAVRTFSCSWRFTRCLRLAVVAGANGIRFDAGARLAAGGNGNTVGICEHEAIRPFPSYPNAGALLFIWVTARGRCMVRSRAAIRTASSTGFGGSLGSRGVEAAMRRRASVRTQIHGDFQYWTARGMQKSKRTGGVVEIDCQEMLAHALEPEFQQQGFFLPAREFSWLRLLPVRWWYC